MSLPHTIHGVESEPYNIYSAKQSWIPGQRMELPDGRIYRGALNSSTATALESCNLTQSEVEATFVTLAIQTALVVGDTAIKLTNASTFLALNEAKGGYVSVWTVGTPPVNGQTYRIWSNNKTNGNTTAILQLWPGVRVKEAITASGKGSIVINPWRNVIVSPASTATGLYTGVTLTNVTKSYYCWLQTRGVCGIVVDDAATLDPGDTVSVIQALDTGSVENADAAEFHLLGHAINDGASDDIGFVFLLID